MASGSSGYAGINRGRSARATARGNSTPTYTSNRTSANYTPF